MSIDAWKTVEARLKRLHVFPHDLSEHFVRSGGHGGQNVNKVSSCVVLTHHPSGISVRCDEERSQTQNRIIARQRLADQIERRERERQLEKRQLAEKQRRQKRERNKTSKERTLKFKRHRAEIKKSRRASWSHEE